MFVIFEKRRSCARTKMHIRFMTHCNLCDIYNVKMSHYIICPQKIRTSPLINCENHFRCGRQRASNLHHCHFPSFHFDLPVLDISSITKLAARVRVCGRMKSCTRQFTCSICSDSNATSLCKTQPLQ